MMRRAAFIAALLGLVAGCAGLDFPGAKSGPAADAAVPDTGYVLDDPSETPAPVADATEEPQPLGELAPKRAPAPEKQAEPEAAPEETGPDLNAAARLACQKDKGTLTKTGSGLFVCVQQTGQGLKSCKSSTQCKGVCLARSGTCSPLTPLLGCNEVITSGGGRATVCID